MATLESQLCPSVAPFFPLYNDQYQDVVIPKGCHFVAFRLTPVVPPADVVVVSAYSFTPLSPHNLQRINVPHG